MFIVKVYLFMIALTTIGALKCYFNDYNYNRKKKSRIRTGDKILNSILNHKNETI